MAEAWGQGEPWWGGGAQTCQQLVCGGSSDGHSPWIVPRNPSPGELPAGTQAEGPVTHASTACSVLCGGRGGLVCGTEPGGAGPVTAEAGGGG